MVFWSISMADRSRSCGQMLAASKSASWPLRLYYSISLEDDIKV
jgi:hypothetical protein